MLNDRKPFQNNDTVSTAVALGFASQQDSYFEKVRSLGVTGRPLKEQGEIHLANYSATLTSSIAMLPIAPDRVHGTNTQTHTGKFKGGIGEGVRYAF